MEQSITFVDVETPNYQNNSISSIGVINVDGDGVVTTKYFLLSLFPLVGSKHLTY